MMKKNLLFLLIMMLGVFMTSYVQAANVTWTGASGGSWEVGSNWDTGNAPGTADHAKINSAVTITGVPGSAINRLTITAAVTLHLSLDVTSNHHAIIVNSGGALNLGDGTTAHTLNASTTATNRNPIALSAAATLTVATNATINVSGTYARGLRVLNGTTLTNNGTINISGQYVSNALQSQGTASPTGIIDNYGSITITATSSGTTSAFTSAGVFNNKTGGSLTLTADVAATVVNPLIVTATGASTNDGTITLSGGEADSRLNVTGPMTNNACGTIDLGDGRAAVFGTFTNDGLLKTTYAGNATNGSGTSTNNGFAIATNGVWGGTDNGLISTSNPLNVVVDALNTCGATDIGIDAIHNWYSDVAMTTLVGDNDIAGMLAIEDNAYTTSGPHTLYSCYGTDVTMTLSGLDGACLPVELMSFEGVRKEDNVELTWVTASEENNYGFEVERAYKNGAELEWEMIDFVEGAGTTYDVQTYSFDDVQPFRGTNYYRLKQLDFDGQFEYSNIVSVEFGVGAGIYEVKISPNPVRSQLVLEDGIGQVTIFNVLGQPVKNVQATDASYAISLADLPNGQYIIRVQKEDGTIGVQQFLKID